MGALFPRYLLSCNPIPLGFPCRPENKTKGVAELKNASIQAVSLASLRSLVVFAFDSGRLNLTFLWRDSEAAKSDTR